MTTLIRLPLPALCSKHLNQKLFVTFILIIFVTGLKAQNTSYNLNLIPINGIENCGFGYKTFFSNTTGRNNVALGFQALLSNTSGQNNSAIGWKALMTNNSGSQNTAIGPQSLTNNTSGNFNTGVGIAALEANLTGSYNTALGQSLGGNTIGFYNTASGYFSMISNKTGSTNTAVGAYSLFYNDNGSNNTGYGFGSMLNNISGNNNTTVGYYSNVGTANLNNATAIGSNAIVNASNTIQLGDANVTQIFGGVGTASKFISGGLQITGGSPGSGKVLTSDAIGNATWQPAGGGGGSTAWDINGNAGTIDGVNFIGTTDNVPLNFIVNNQPAGRIDMDLLNSFYGVEAGRDNGSGRENCAFGYNALRLNTDYANTAVGAYALASSISGIGNTAIGNRTLRDNKFGFGNTGLGASALQFNTDGFGNTGCGASALEHNTIGVDNTALGGSALGNTTTGSSNIGIGDNCLQYNYTGNSNTFVGSSANFSSPGSNFDNSSAFGAGVIINMSNKIRLGSSTVTMVEGPVSYTVSDGRFKNNIKEEDVKGLEFIKRLRPVVYNFDTRKFQEFLTQSMPDSVKKKYFEKKDFAPSTAIRQSGFIAQEVEKAAKEVGYDFNGVHVPESKDDNYSLAYSEFVVPLVKSVQELSRQNDSLKKEIAEIKAMIISNSAAKSNNGSISIAATAEGAKLFQNAPNPFSKTTTIQYTLPINVKTAMLIITSSNGKKIKEYNLTGSKAEALNINGGQFAPGIYIYSLYVDNKLVDSRQMILTK